VLRRAAPARRFVELEARSAVERDAPPDRRVEPRQVVAQGAHLAAQRRRVVAVRGRVDVVGRIDRERHEAPLGRAFDVVRVLQVVGVRADPSVEAGALGARDRVAHDGARCAAGTRHLAERLLREDRRDPAPRPRQRRDVPRRRRADAVAEPEARRRADRADRDCHRAGGYAGARRRSRPVPAHRRRAGRRIGPPGYRDAAMRPAIVPPAALLPALLALAPLAAQDGTYWPGPFDDWEVRSPDSVGMDAERLAEAIAFAE